MNKENIKNNSRKIITYILFFVIAWFIISFLIIPNIQIAFTSLFPNGHFSSKTFKKVLNSPRALDSLKNSFLLAICVSVTANVVGIFLVLVIDYFKIKGSKILFIGYATSLVFGGIVLANAYQYVYGRNGLITQLLLKVFPNMNPEWFIGFPAVLFTLTFASTTLHLLLLRDALKEIDYQSIEAARNLGANQFQIITKVVLPALKPYLITLTILCFQTGLGAMSSPLILGGKDFQTIAPIILNFTNVPSSRDLAALLSIILGLVQIVLLTCALISERKATHLSGSKVKTRIKKQKIENKPINLIVHIVAWIIFFIYIIPLIVVIIYSFLPVDQITSGKIDLTKLTLENYKEVFMTAEGITPFITSIVYSTCASVITVVFITFVARLITKKKNWISNILEMALYIPWMLPGILFALGLILTYNLPKFWIGNHILTGTLFIMLIAYIIVVIPFSLRIIKSAYAGVNNELEEAAKNLGASPLTTFRKIVLPVIFPAILAVTALNINNLLSNFDVSLFLYHPLFEPLGVTIYNTSNSPQVPNAPALSLVYSVTLIVINAIILYLVYGKGKDLNKTF